MGGNVFPGQNERMTSEEFYSIRKRVIKSVKGGLGDIPMRIEGIQPYTDKETHGDIDILVGELPKKNFMFNFLKRLVDVKACKKNGPVISCLWYDEPTEKHVQVDFIETPESTFDFALGYFNYNDLGNLIGKIAHYAGFKLGHDGLHYVMRDNTEVIEQITLTTDWNRAIELFGFTRYEDWNFQTVDDVYRFVWDSPWVRAEMYDLDKLSHAQRTRDRKRATYTGFLEWVSEQKPRIPFIRTDARRFFMNRAKTLFRDFENDVYNAARKHYRKKTVRRKFNGNLVMEETGLSGKNLGNFILCFKRKFHSQSDFEEWVINSTDNEIRTAVKRRQTGRRSS